MIKKVDWFSDAPSFVNMDELVGELQLSGSDSWFDRIVDDLGDSQLNPNEMSVFVMAHGGVYKDIISPSSNFSLFAGGKKEIYIRSETSKSNNDINLTLTLENAPNWITVQNNIIKINPPVNMESSRYENIFVYASKNNIKIGRKKNFSVTILDSVLLIAGTLDENGGKIENEWKDITISVEPNLLLQSYSINYFAGYKDGQLKLLFKSTPAMTPAERIKLNIIIPTDRILIQNYLQNNEGSSRSLRSTDSNNNLCTNGSDALAIWPESEKTFKFKEIILNDSAYYEDLWGKDGEGYPRLVSKTQGDSPVKECSFRVWSPVEKNQLSSASNPVLLIHGFISAGNLGALSGGDEYFASLPKVLKAGGYDPFIFDWQTNASFTVVADDLARAIKIIGDSTGKQVHLLAHSYGGLLSRTLIQGQAKNNQLYNRDFVEKYIASLTTVGTPHSGVWDHAVAIDGKNFLKDGVSTTLGNGEVINFKRGQSGVAGAVIDLCEALTCHESGAYYNDINNDTAWSQYNVHDNEGSIPYILASAIDEYPNISTQALIGLRVYDNGLPMSPSRTRAIECVRNAESNTCTMTYEFNKKNMGDQLISLYGQRLHYDNYNKNVVSRDLVSGSVFEEHLLGLKRISDAVNLESLDFDLTNFTSNNVSIFYKFNTLDYMDTSFGNEVNKFLLGYNHRTARWHKSVSIDNPGHNERVEGLTEVGLHECSSVTLDTISSCLHPTWIYFKKFASDNPATEINPPEKISLSGDVEYRGVVDTQLANASINRDVSSVVPFPVIIEAYNGSVFGAFFNPLNRTTLSADGTYELNVTYSPDTNYTVIAYPEGNTAARIGEFVRASASVFLTTFTTIEESILQFPTIVLTDGNFAEGNLTIKVKDGQTGTVLNGFDAKIVNTTGNHINENDTLNINTGYVTTLPKAQYTVYVTKDGYNDGKEVCTVTAEQNVECSIRMVSSAAIAEGEVSVVMSWGTSPRDLDSHLVRKTNGNQDYHVYYSHKNDTDANLDRDDVDGVGPETITISSISPSSVYTYYVYKYSNSGNELKDSGAKVELNVNGSQIPYNVPNEDGRYWKVFEIINGRIIPCQTGCMGGSVGDIVRDIDQDAYLFENLPAKN